MATKLSDVVAADGNLKVVAGGTGAATLTAHGVLVGEGTSAIAATPAGAAGTVLQGGGASADPTFTETPTLGVVSSVTGQLKLANSASANLTILQAGNAAAARTYTWPTNFGAANTFLKDVGGDGTLSWAAAATAPGGSDTQVQFNDGGVFGGDAGLVYNKTTDALTAAGSITINNAAAASGVTLLTVQNSNLTGSPGFEFRAANGGSYFLAHQGNSGGGLAFRDFATNQLFEIDCSVGGGYWTILGVSGGGYGGTLGDLVTQDGLASIGDATHRVKSIFVAGYVTTGGLSRVSTQFDKTSNTTLGNVTGLTVNVAAGRTYSFRAVLYTTSNIGGGVQAAIGGTATATAIVYQGRTLSSTTVGANDRATALGTAVGAITTVTVAFIEIDGTITVNAAGTLTVQFAQNASNGAASSVLVGSSFIVNDMP